MNATARRQDILQYIIQKGAAQVDELTALYEVSRMTIHRDLDSLERQGVIRKVRGGATVQSSSLVESSFRYRSQISVQIKEELARAAARYIEPGQAIIIDDSTTTIGLTKVIPNLRPLTVITNSLDVIQQLSNVPGIDLIALGGLYNTRFNAFFGLQCEQAIANLRANRLFMSVSAIHGMTAFHQEQQVVQTKRAMMGAVEKRFLLADHSKFGTTALHRLANLSEFDHVITDGDVGKGYLDLLHEGRVSFEIVDR